MSRVVTYANNNYQCFCQIELDNGERILISIAALPIPSIKIMELSRSGWWPRRTVWEYDSKIAGGEENYARDLFEMFDGSVDGTFKHPLDILRDRFLTCRSISDIKNSISNAEQKKPATPR